MNEIIIWAVVILGPLVALGVAAAIVRRIYELLLGALRGKPTAAPASTITKVVRGSAPVNASPEYLESQRKIAESLAMTQWSND